MRLPTLIFIYIITQIRAQNPTTFPSNFKFGVSTSSYQIEGAWNEDGKSENIWDRFTHTHPERIKDASTGDIACDSYHKYELDIEKLKFLNVDFYRFSLSWSRILPTGFANKINKKGVDYYNNLIDKLIENGIEPMVTLYHWDLPQSLQDLGGWPNPFLADYFEEYARTAFTLFGDRVKSWITFNEPKLICVYGYSEGKMAPGLNSSGIGDYLCGHTLLKAHARAYRLYQRDFKEHQRGKVGISIHSEWFEPNLDTPEHKEASDRKLTFDFGWFAHPIFHPSGDYPPVMKNRISENSQKGHFPSSRLPQFSTFEINFIKGTADFLGLNMYTASLIEDVDDYKISEVPNYYNDIGVRTWKDPAWPKSAAVRLVVVPWSLRRLLLWITQHYGNMNIIITENGYADRKGVEDYERVNFHKEYMRSLLEAMYIDKINVTGYTAWSLIDNFEWYNGYTEKYGLFAIDKNFERIPKKSAYYYQKVIETKDIEWTDDESDFSEFLSGSSRRHFSSTWMIFFIFSVKFLLNIGC